jgi:hypothetical protein
MSDGMTSAHDGELHGHATGRVPSLVARAMASFGMKVVRVALTPRLTPNALRECAKPQS